MHFTAETCSQSLELSFAPPAGAKNFSAAQLVAKESFSSSACSKGKFQQLSFAPSAVAKEIFCSSASSKGKFQRLSFAPPAVAKEIFCSSACSKGKFQQLSFACNCNQLELIVVCGYVACAQHVVYRRSKLYGFEVEAKARGSSCPRDGGACG